MGLKEIHDNLKEKYKDSMTDMMYALSVPLLMMMVFFTGIPMFVVFIHIQTGLILFAVLFLPFVQE